VIDPGLVRPVLRRAGRATSCARTNRFGTAPSPA